MVKEFKKPDLTDDKWKKVQDYLSDISKLTIQVENKLTELDVKSKEIKESMDKISISLGLLDSVLGREYTLEELKEEFEELKNRKKESLKNEAKWLWLSGNEKVWILCCDSNLGDYFVKYVTESEYKQYEELVIKIFTSTYDMHRYVEEHNI